MKKVSPLLIIILALGVFGIITTEMSVVGVLPQIAQKFAVSTSQAGLLVSVFALVVAPGMGDNSAVKVRYRLGSRNC